MQTLALVLAVGVTALYGYGAQATIAADLARARAPTVVLPRAEPVWYGGELAPVMVEARLEGTTLVRHVDACLAEKPRG